MNCAGLLSVGGWSTTEPHTGEAVPYTRIHASDASSRAPPSCQCVRAGLRAACSGGVLPASSDARTFHWVWSEWRWW
jgi:hypothetical protein